MAVCHHWDCISIGSWYRQCFFKEDALAFICGKMSLPSQISSWDLAGGKAHPFCYSIWACDKIFRLDSVLPKFTAQLTVIKRPWFKVSETRCNCVSQEGLTGNKDVFHRYLSDNNHPGGSYSGRRLRRMECKQGWGGSVTRSLALSTGRWSWKCSTSEDNLLNYPKNNAVGHMLV